MDSRNYAKSFDPYSVIILIDTDFLTFKPSIDHPYIPLSRCFLISCKRHPDLVQPHEHIEVHLL